ncbi:TRAP transporter large permease [Azospirillum halopraeferens]|uniref:TRAP transporter large permease n=1 Tax=Azospirillum halopraeferens TaxID=34010 RepID=UPI000402E658|nr:TRAP transporter large permease subunit [Azospirillum halopraeferens]
MEAFEIIVTGLLVLFILLLFTGFPIAWILGGLSVAFTGLGILLSNHFDVDTFLLDAWSDFAIIADRIWAQVGNWVLVALPMFVFMGQMLDRSGVAEKMMHNFVRAFGRMRGGLALTVVLIGVLLAASTGIVGASVVLLAMMSIPVMQQHRYSRELASGVVAASGTLGILIPPSIMLVLMADQLSLPVGDLFMGALMPGLLLGGLYMAYVIIIANLKPDLAPIDENQPPLDWRAVLNVVLAVLPALALILAVLGTIFFGIATPTEASGVGAFGATLLAAANGRLTLTVLREACRATMHTTAFIFAIFLGATAFSLVMRSLGGDEFIADLLKGLPFEPTGVVIFILLIAFLLGFFLDWLEITLIMLPLVAPVVQALGFDMVWFVVIFAVCLQTSFLTPPVGFSLFYLKGVCPPGFTIMHIYRGVIPFVLLQAAAVTACFYWQELVLWLPRQVYGG